MSKLTVSLAELLIRRTELKEILARAKPIQDKDIFEVRVNLVKVAEGVDEVTVGVPKVAFQQVEAHWNHHSQLLRQVDAMIQRLNWDTKVEVDPSVMAAWVDPYVKEAEKS